MPVTQLPPQRTWGSAIGKALMNYMQGKQIKKREGLEEQQFGIESALMQSQTQRHLAEAEEARRPKELSGADMLNRWRLEQLGKYSPQEQKQYLLKPSTSVTTNIDLGKTSPLEKSTKGALEREITDIDDILGLLDEVDKLTEDEFLTWGGKVKKGATRLDELTGRFMNIPGADPDYLAKYSAWKLPAQEIYLKKRHEITGVAANPAEKEEIAEAIPDPNKNTPTEYKAKSMQLRKLLIQAKNRKMMFRAVGIANPTPEQLSQMPLSSVPINSAEAQKGAHRVLLGTKLGGKESKPKDYPDAVWSEEHQMWTVIREGRLKGVK